jgi:hypothetical protein
MLGTLLSDPAATGNPAGGVGVRALSVADFLQFAYATAGKTESSGYQAASYAA